jgi:hypothetical protein
VGGGDSRAEAGADRALGATMDFFNVAWARLNASEASWSFISGQATWGLPLARTSGREVDPWSSAMVGGVGGLSGRQKTRLAVGWEG